MYDVIYRIMYVFLFFFIASVIGYMVEVIFCSLDQRKFIWNRGFLIGPYIPIYGVGTITILSLLRKYFQDPLVLFFLTVIICSTLEYFTSWIMEKLFKVRWWDYSKEKFNIDGRICLSSSVLFGLSGLIVVYLIYPLISSLLNIIPHLTLIIVSFICCIIFLIDLILTTSTLIGVRKTLAEFKGKDVTEIARSEVIKKIKHKTFFFNRLFKAFPKIDQFNNKNIIELKNSVSNFRNKLKEKKKNVKAKINSKRNQSDK